MRSPLTVPYFSINEAGFPPGVINIITGAGSTGNLLASHMNIDKVAFTGSAVAGKAVMVAAAKSNMKHVSLELGGKSPALIFDDADLANAVEHSSTSFLRNSGQVRHSSHPQVSVRIADPLRADMLCRQSSLRPREHCSKIHRGHQDCFRDSSAENGRPVFGRNSFRSTR